MVSAASRRGGRGERSSGGGGERDRRGGRGGRGRDREQRPREDDSGGFSERVVHTRRIAKVVKGGRRLRFNALVVVGDGQGRVGAGMGKALAIPDAVRKGTAVARRSTVAIPIKGSTIPHEISVRKGASIVIIKPAPLGTGIIAAGAMRAMLELGGVRDVVGKSLGSRNPINIVQATMEALSLLRDPETERAARLGQVASEAGANGATASATAAATPATAPATPSAVASTTPAAASDTPSGPPTATAPAAEETAAAVESETAAPTAVVAAEPEAAVADVPAESESAPEPTAEATGVPADAADAAAAESEPEPNNDAAEAEPEASSQV